MEEIKVGGTYLPKQPQPVSVTSLKESKYDSEGALIYAGFVNYINHVGAECTKTYTQFQADNYYLRED